MFHLLDNIVHLFKELSSLRNVRAATAFQINETYKFKGESLQFWRLLKILFFYNFIET
jgi:hypothetical protein